MPQLSGVIALAEGFPNLFGILKLKFGFDFIFDLSGPFDSLGKLLQPPFLLHDLHLPLLLTFVDLIYHVLILWLYVGGPNKFLFNISFVGLLRELKFMLGRIRYFGVQCPFSIYFIVRVVVVYLWTLRVSLLLKYVF